MTTLHAPTTKSNLVNVPRVQDTDGAGDGGGGPDVVACVRVGFILSVSKQRRTGSSKPTCIQLTRDHDYPDARAVAGGDGLVCFVVQCVVWW